MSGVALQPSGCGILESGGRTWSVHELRVNRVRILKGALWIFSKLSCMIWTLLVSSGSCYYSNPGYISHTLFWNQDPDMNSNETFYMPVANMNINETSCQVYTNNEVLSGVRPFKDANQVTLGSLSEIIAVNSSHIGVVGTLPKNESTTLIMTDYIAVKYSPNYFYELGIYYNISNGKTFIDYRDYRLDKVIPNMTNLSITYSTPGVVRAWIAKDANIVFEVCYEVIIDTVYVFFKVGYFNASVSGNFRKTVLFSFNHTLNTHDLGVRLKDVQLIALGVHESNNYQFIVSNRNSSLIYLVNCIDGLAKTGRLTVAPVQTNITLNRFLYVENQFLVIEQNMTFPDVNNKPVDSYMNYYLEHYIGMKLEATDFVNIRNLSRGRLINTYFSLETNLVLLDFIMPDLDGVVDETPLSSLYYSKESQRFEVFLEEFSINKQGQSYINGSYFRVQTKDYLVEVYTQPNRSQYPIMSLTHRKTNRDVGEVMLPNKRKIRWLHYFKVDNILLIKYEVPATELLKEAHTQLLVLQEPFVSYTLKPIPIQKLMQPLTPESYRSQSNRVLQIQPQIPNMFNLEVRCQSQNPTNPSLPLVDNSRLFVNFMLARNDSEYFDIIRKNPDNSSDLVKKLYSTMTSQKVMDGLKPNGVEINFAVSNLTSGSFYELWVTKNGTSVEVPLKNMRREVYRIKLPNLDVSQPVMFEQRSGTRASTSLILDLSGKTSYYTLIGNEFSHAKDAQDSRNLSSVSMLSSGNAIINISKNIFSFDVNNIKERPLTGVGSFCVNVENIQSCDSASFLMCMTEDSVQIQYTKELFSAAATQLPFVGPDFTNILRKSMLVKMLYSLTFPSHVFMLAHSRMNILSRSYEIQVYETFVNSRIQMHQLLRVPLDRLGEALRNPTTKLVYADLLDDQFVFVTSKGEIFVYKLTRNFEIDSKLKVEFVRKYTLTEHFKPFKITIDGKTIETESSASIKRILKLEVVAVEKNNVRGEKFTVKKIGMQVTIQNSRLKKNYDVVVVFDPSKSSYSAFDLVFSGSRCAKLFMGPMFLNEGEKSERRLVVACVPGKPDQVLNIQKSMYADIYVLSDLESRFDLSDEGSIPELQQLTDFSVKSLNEGAFQEYNYKASWTKAYYMLDLVENSKEKNLYDQAQLERIRPSKSFKVSYADTFLRFQAKIPSAADATLSVNENEDSTAFGLLSKKGRTEINRPLPNYFEGHIYSSQLTCESYIECRDKVINGTGSLLYTYLMPKFPMKEWRLGSKQRLGVIDISSGKTEQPAITFAIDDNVIFQNKENQIERYEYSMVDSSCSDFVNFEFYLIAICVNNNKYNYFLVVNMRENFNWYYIPFSLPSKRLVAGNDARLQVSENYLMLTTYNPFFKRFLTVYLFKLNLHSEYESSERILSFSSPLNRNLSLVFFAESPMNDEFITIKPYRPKLSNPETYNPLTTEALNTTELVYVLCLRRLTSSTYSIRYDAYEIKSSPSTKPGSKFTMLKVDRLAEERRMLLNFSVPEQIEYLLDDASLLLLNMDDPLLLDVIFHLPNSQDYLLRVNRTFIESAPGVKPPNSSISIFESTKILAISSPFLGATPTRTVPPIFDKDYYYVAAVYYPEKSFIRCYYINEELKNKAQPFSNRDQTFLFNFMETLPKSGVILERDFQAGYTYAVLGFAGAIRTVQIRQPSFEKGDFVFNRTFHKGSKLISYRKILDIQEYIHHLQERYLPQGWSIQTLHTGAEL